MKPCGNCDVEKIAKQADPSLLREAKAACLTIAGLGCQNCVTRVRNSLLSMRGVFQVEIALEDGLAVVAYDPRTVHPVQIVQAVASAGSDGRHHYWANIIGIRNASEVLQTPRSRGEDLGEKIQHGS